MKSIQEIQKLTANGLLSSLDLLEEILQRKKLQDTMVGTLYPSILDNEIYQIAQLRKGIK